MLRSHRPVLVALLYCSDNLPWRFGGAGRSLRINSIAGTHPAPVIHRVAKTAQHLNRRPTHQSHQQLPSSHATDRVAEVEADDEHIDAALHSGGGVVLIRVCCHELMVIQLNIYCSNLWGETIVIMPKIIFATKKPATCLTNRRNHTRGAGGGSRTLVSSLGRIHNSRYTTPAYLYYTTVVASVL